MYLLPLIEHLASSPACGVGGLILAPSRELVLQIAQDLDRLCGYHALQAVPLVGGVPRHREEQVIRRRRPQVLVSTLRKLLEHFEATQRASEPTEA